MTANLSAASLDCRLLAASVAAYGINPDGSFTPDPAFYDAVGFKSEPTLITGGVANIDAALVGTNGDGVILAFRGTLPPTPPISEPILLDWLQDFFAEPNGYIDFPGKVHSGFFGAWLNLWAPILQAVKAQRGTDLPVYVTGHSKGGSLTYLGAWSLHTAGITPAGVVSFAAAHVGDPGFADAYSQVFPNHLRYENTLDVVPFLPPDSAFDKIAEKLPVLGKLFEMAADWNYVPAGVLRYIESSGEVIGDNPLLEAARIAEILEKLVTLDLSAITAAHSATGGYNKGACTSAIG